MFRRVPALVRVTRARRDEVERRSRADELMADPCDRWVRCITITAPSPHVYRWLCQLTIAPYSFDLVDNAGRSSPAHLTPDADDLSIGRPFLIFSITDFEEGRFIAGRSRPRFRRVYGDITVSYEIHPLPSGTTRLQANACISHRTGLMRRALLASGDKIMAGRQLRVLKRRAETSPGARPP